MSDGSGCPVDGCNSRLGMQPFITGSVRCGHLWAPQQRPQSLLRPPLAAWLSWRSCFVRSDRALNSIAMCVFPRPGDHDNMAAEGAHSASSPSTASTAAPVPLLQRLHRI